MVAAASRVHQPPPLAAFPRQALPPIDPPSDVGGEWPVDHASAQRFAEQTLASIDWSKPTLVLYIPGTANPAKGEVQKVNPQFVAQVGQRWSKDEAALAMLRYEGSWSIRTSISTGVEVLRLVLRAIAARPAPRPRVLIGGESQGAWVASEALKDPVARAVVQRAAIFGHPSLAATHYTDGHDPAVLETNHPLDHVSMPLRGDRARALEAQIALETELTLDKVPLLLGALLDNPRAGAMSLLSQVRNRLPEDWRGLIADHHDYRADMRRGVQFLFDGVRTPHPSTGH